MKLALLGGCGYLGATLYDYLEQHNPDVVSYDLEWYGCPAIPNWRRDYNSLTERELDRFDAVLLFAAHSSVPMCQADPIGAHENNVSNFLRLLKKLKKQKLVYASSSCVYTGSLLGPSETNQSLVPRDVLTLTKTAIDYYAQNSDVEFYSLRLGSMAGPSPNLRTDLLVNSMVHSAMKDGMVRISNRYCCRPILAVHDLCRAVGAILKGGDQRGIYNLAGWDATMEETGSQIAALLNVPVELLPNTGTYNFYLNTDKFKQAYDFTYDYTDVDGVVYDLMHHPQIWRTGGDRTRNMGYAHG